MNLQYRIDKYRSNWLALNNSFINKLITKGELDEGNRILKDEVKLIIKIKESQS